jgi:hypothetical protein
LPCVISVQALQTPQGVGVGPSSQFTALARILAAEVFPTPRGPEKRYAWAIRPALIEFFIVDTTNSCPTRSSKRPGRLRVAVTSYAILRELYMIRKRLSS